MHGRRMCVQQQLQSGAFINCLHAVHVEFGMASTTSGIGQWVKALLNTDKACKTELRTSGTSAVCSCSNAGALQLTKPFRDTLVSTSYSCFLASMMCRKAAELQITQHVLCSTYTQ